MPHSSEFIRIRLRNEGGFRYNNYKLTISKQNNINNNERLYSTELIKTKIKKYVLLSPNLLLAKLMVSTHILISDDNILVEPFAISQIF